MFKELRPYQVKATETIKRNWLGNRAGNTYRKQLLVLATGLGKTIAFADLAGWVRNEFNGRVLVLAHREELLEQAEEKMMGVIGTDVMFGREQAQSQASLMDQIVTASVPTLGRGKTGTENREYNSVTMQWETPERPNDRLLKFPKDHFKLVIIDEAHHAPAKTYQNIIKYFDAAWVLGVTATPKRGDKESLRNIFDKVAFKMDIVDGMMEGWLAPVIAHRVSSKTDLQGVRTTAGDYNLKDLAKAVNNDERNSLIVKTYHERFDGRQAIVFATDVSHAQALRQEFYATGVVTECITGDMPKSERREYIAAFKAGKIEVLTNYGVLTEGFDHASLDVIINARPTKSALLLTQILGRGTRIWEEKTHMDFVEIIDNHSDDTATAAEIFGFNKTFDCNGHSFLECILEADRMEREKEHFPAWTCKSWDDMQEKFAKAPKYEAPDAKLPKERHFDSRYRYYATANGNLQFTHTERFKDDASGAETKKAYIVRIEEDPLGGYLGFVAEKGAEESRLLMVDGATRLDVAKKLEMSIRSQFPSWDRLLNNNAGWKKKAANEPCSDKQWAMICKFRLHRGQPRESISKAAASDMLARVFNR